ncbi:MAG TPA: hypothetical protein VM737_12440 [Gemmatimonadota bacterium]|nr:hypothetical protein [Gemmatimonadota bacterium]
MKRNRAAKKNLRLSQAKIDEANRMLGTSTEIETIEQALDLLAFRQEVMDGIDQIAGKGTVRNMLASQRDS